MTAALESLEARIGRASEMLRLMRAERESLRRENAQLLEEVRALRDRVAELARAAADPVQGRRLRKLERQRRELRGRVAELLRLAEELDEGR